MPVGDGNNTRDAVVLGPGEGRDYPMGRISAVFKADGAETGESYSISEWWLDPYTTGPGSHSHPADDVFYVLVGTVSFLIDTHWIEAGAGSFVLVPSDVTHDFQNRGSERAGILNVKMAGNFEEEMPAIAQWFIEHPPADSVPNRTSINRTKVRSSGSEERSEASASDNSHATYRDSC